MTTEPDGDAASFHDWTGSLTDSEPEDAMHWTPGETLEHIDDLLNHP